ncbi:MAG: ATPase involved in chromosome partitioning [Planctomycetota bacterium]|nr:ATPase involved in chromosome partitioning [Planctomycetota bacterium]
MISVAFLNQKGGVGKTSLCHHLAGALADLGRQVLLVDYDPQASLTQGLLGPDEAETLPIELTAAAIVAGQMPDPMDVIRQVGERTRLVPGSAAAGEWNVANPYRLQGSERAALRRFLAEAAAEAAYDYCLVDCPPNLSMCAAQALAAAEFLAIPTQPEDYGAQGLRPVLDFFADARDEDNPFLKLAGVIVNRKARFAIHATYEARLRKLYAGDVFTAVVPQLVSYVEAISFRLPISRHDPRSNAAEAMRAVADEFLIRTRGDLP